MNFMNNSIFQRNKACEREEESPEEGGVLAVWGSPSSGKTVVSVKLAEHLAKKKRKRYLNSCRYDYATSALLMRSFRYGTGEIAWKYSCSSTCDRKSDKKELHVLSEERTSVHNRNVERRECIHISAL